MPPKTTLELRADFGSLDIIVGAAVAAGLLLLAWRIQRRRRMPWLVWGLGVYLLAGLANGAYHVWYRGLDQAEFLNNARYLLHITSRQHPDAWDLWLMPPWGLVPSELVLPHDLCLNLRSVYNLGFVRLVAVLLVVSLNTVVAPILLLSALAYSGWVALLVAVRQRVVQIRPQWVWGVMLLPSVLFWSTGLAKDTVLVAALGWLGWLLLVRPSRLLPWIGVGALVLLAYTIKPYVLLAAVATGLVWPVLYGLQRWPRLAWLGVIVGLLLGLGLLSLSTFDLDRIWLELTWNRSFQTTVLQPLAGASSYFDIGLPPEPSPWQVVSLVPLAALTGLFRPWPWEATSLPLLVFAVESIFFLVLCLWQVRNLRLAACREQPWALSFVLFAIGYAAVLGLSVMFFGSLVRYRAILWPYLWLGLLALRHHDPSADRLAPPR